MFMYVFKLTREKGGYELGTEHETRSAQDTMSSWEWGKSSKLKDFNSAYFKKFGELHSCELGVFRF